MKPEVIKFYKSKGLPIEQIIQRGSYVRGLKQAPIYEALERIYHDYKKGKIEKDLSIVWRVWALAQAVSGRTFDKLLKTKTQLSNEIAELQRINRELRIAVISLSIAFAATIVWILFEVMA